MPEIQRLAEREYVPSTDSLIHEELLHAVNPDNRRGMLDLLDGLPGDALRRAAQGLLATSREVLILTGFAVAGQPETDGPPGAIALYRALRRLGRRVRIGSWPALLTRLHGIAAEIETLEIPLPGALPIVRVPLPDVDVISIEVCGCDRDGRYRDMRGEDISDSALPVEARIGDHALIAIGDGGNEFGMGSAPATFFERWPVRQPVSTCDYLIPAAVSNDGAYALLAAMEVLTGRHGLLPSQNEALLLLEQLHVAGFVDGFSGQAHRAVDGRPFSEALGALRRLRAIVARHRSTHTPDGAARGHPA